MSGEIPKHRFKGPGYPLIIALLNLVIGDLFVSGKILSVISGTVFLFFTYKLFQDIFSPQLALFTVIFLAINPLFLQYSIAASTDMLFAALITVFFYSSISNNDKYFWNLTSGISVGCAFITRYNAFFLPIIYVIILTFAKPETLPSKRKIKLISVFLLSYFSVVTPWLVINRLHNGSFLYNENYLNVASGIYSLGGGSCEALSLASKKFHSILDVFLYNPKLFILNYTKNILYYSKNILVSRFLFPFPLFAIPGFFSLITNKSKDKEKKRLYYFIFIGFYFAVSCLVFYLPRVYIIILPILILFQ